VLRIKVLRQLRTAARWKNVVVTAKKKRPENGTAGR